MRSAASMESLPCKYQGRHAKERFLVFAMLQLAPRFSAEARHCRNERSGLVTRRPLSFHRIFGQQNKIDVAMPSRTSVDSHARLRSTRNLVPGLRSQSAPPIGSAPENCSKPGRRLSFAHLRERTHAAHLVLRSRTSLERYTRQSETRLMVSEMRGHSPQK